VSTFACALLVGCGGGDKASNNFTPLPSTGGGGNTTVGDTTGFYVSVKDNDDINLETKIHKFNDFSASCSVPSTTTTGQDISCLLNVKEADLFIAGLTMQVNFPSTMCRYLVTYPYWYYKDEPGIGPAVLAIDYDTDQKIINSCTIDGVAGTLNPAKTVCTGTEGYFTNTGSFTCEYGDCCMGTGVVTKTITASSLTTTNAPETLEYGGKFGNCASGAGLLNWKLDSTYGLPRAVVTNSTDVKSEYKIAAAISNDKSKNLVGANMYAWTDYVAGTHATATVPMAMSYDTDLSGSAINEPNPAYQFYCMDENFETKHRINVYVNEWDTKSAFETYILAGSTSVSPNSAPTDTEGVNCFSEGVLGGDCDDFWDWDRNTVNGNGFPGE
jgi:hypothetical protein